MDDKKPRDRQEGEQLDKGHWARLQQRLRGSSLLVLFLAGLTGGAIGGAGGSQMDRFFERDRPPAEWVLRNQLATEEQLEYLYHRLAALHPAFNSGSLTHTESYELAQIADQLDDIAEDDDIEWTASMRQQLEQVRQLWGNIDAGPPDSVRDRAATLELQYSTVVDLLARLCDGDVR